MGHDQAGVSETIEFILSKYPTDVQRQLAANVFVTGGLAALPGVKERLVADLRRMRPAGDVIGVVMAADPSGDAWRGAREFVLSAESTAYLSRDEYFERGAEWLKEHPFSNRFFPTPFATPQT